MVQAANQTAQSLPSASIFVTLPEAGAAVAKAAAPASGETVAGYTSHATASTPAAEGNGSTRGNRRPVSNGTAH